jgi:hypothetical protein
MPAMKAIKAGTKMEMKLAVVLRTVGRATARNVVPKGGSRFHHLTGLEGVKTMWTQAV